MSLNISSPSDDRSLLEKLGSCSSDLEEVDEQRWRWSVMEECLERIQRNSAMNQETIAIFKAYVLENGGAEEVAARFGIKKNALFQIKNRITRKLKEEVAFLLGNEIEEAT